jgi:hypothetical protein
MIYFPSTIFKNFMIYVGGKNLCNITTKIMNKTSSMMENLLIPNLNKSMAGA